MRDPLRSRGGAGPPGTGGQQPCGGGSAELDDDGPRLGAGAPRDRAQGQQRCEYARGAAQERCWAPVL